MHERIKAIILMQASSALALFNDKSRFVNSSQLARSNSHQTNLESFNQYKKNFTCLPVQTNIYAMAIQLNESVQRMLS